MDPPAWWMRRRRGARDAVPYDEAIVVAGMVSELHAHPQLVLPRLEGEEGSVLGHVVLLLGVVARQGKAIRLQLVRQLLVFLFDPFLGGVAQECACSDQVSAFEVQPHAWTVRAREDGDVHGLAGCDEELHDLAIHVVRHEQRLGGRIPCALVVLAVQVLGERFDAFSPRSILGAHAHERIVQSEFVSFFRSDHRARGLGGSVLRSGHAARLDRISLPPSPCTSLARSLPFPSPVRFVHRPVPRLRLGLVCGVTSHNTCLSGALPSHWTRGEPILGWGRTHP